MTVSSKPQNIASLSASSKNISLRTKFNLVLAAIFLIGLGGSALYYQHSLEKTAMEEVRHDSELLMSTALAIRSYTTNQIKPLLDPLNVERFLPQTVPAFAATETVHLLSNHYPGYEYREAVLNPTNPRDKATDWESELIGLFRQNPQQKEISGIHGDDVQRVMYVARPIKIAQPECLSCHSIPERAPPSMLAVYGSHNGFGWQIGDIVGIQIVKVPVLYPLDKARQSFNNFMMSLLAVFGLMFAGLNLALSLLVIEPIGRTNKKLEELATKDFLTGLSNRRRFFELLESDISEARIRNLALSIIVFDIDFFKRINDTFGHACGDQVLQEISARTHDTLGDVQCIARFGGEEFIILLRDTTLEQAMELAEKLRTQIADIPFEHVGAVSASFGVAQWQHEEDARALINRADKALYVAKQTGRNKVVRASEHPASRKIF